MYARLIGVFVALSLIYILGTTPLVHSDATSTTTTTDTTAPVASNVYPGNVTSNSVQIRWTTDDLSDSRVDYGVPSSTAFGTSYDRCDGGGMVTAHCVNLSNLLANTQYMYQPASTNSAGLTSVPNPSGYSFTTLQSSTQNTSTTTPAGGGGGGSTTDTTPPVITNISGNNITSYSAQIKWNTDDPSDSLVNYGVTTSPNYQTSTARCDGGGYVTSHCVNLTNLSANTFYAYQVVSMNAVQLTAYSASAGASFTTLQSSTQNISTTTSQTSTTTTTTTDTTPPVLSNIYAYNVMTSSVYIKWTTDDPSDTFVGYGTSWVSQYPNYSTNRCDGGGYVTSHCVYLTGLISSTQYYYKPQSTNAVGLVNWQNGYTFTTAPQTTQTTSTSTSGSGGGSTSTTDTTAPNITYINVDNITSSAARVRWQTDDLADSSVTYGSNSAQSLTSTERCDGGGMVTSHCVYLYNLSAGTLYYYMVKSVNGAALAAVSPSTLSFMSLASSNTTTTNTSTTTTTITTTATDATAPVITNIGTTNLTANGVYIKWTTDDPSDSLVNYGVPTSPTYSYSKDRCDAGGSVIAHCVKLSNLSSNTSYAYQVVSVNAAGLRGYSVPAGATFTTLLSTSGDQTTSATQTTAPTAASDTTEPVIMDVKTGSVSSFGAQIKWNTDDLSDSHVMFGTVSLTQVSDKRCDAGGFVTSHCVYLPNLLPGMPYFYKVGSINAAGLGSYAGGFTFATPALSDTSNTSGDTQPTTATAPTANPSIAPVTSAPVQSLQSVVATSSVAQENGLTAQLPAIEAIIKQESGVTVDLSPTTRPIAAPAPIVAPAEQPNIDALREQIAQRNNSQSTFTDSDHDGVSDFDEKMIFNTDANNAHSGGSALNDGERILLGLDPHTDSTNRVPVEDPKTSGATTTEVFEVSAIEVHKVPVAAQIPSTPVPPNEIAPTPSKALQGTAVQPPTSAQAAEPATKEETSFTGRAMPNSFVTLFIFSTPIVVTVKTDLSGSWHYTLNTELPNGDHTLYVASVDASGKILAKSPAVPFVKTAEAAEFTPLVPEATPVTDPLDVLRKNLFVLAVSGISIVGVVVLMLLGAQRDKAPAVLNITETAAPPPTDKPKKGA